MNIPLKELMQEAARLTRAGRLIEATKLIQRALRGAAGDAGEAQQRQSGRVFEMEPPAAQARDGAPQAQSGVTAVARNLGEPSAAPQTSAAQEGTAAGPAAGGVTGGAALADGALRQVNPRHGSSTDASDAAGGSFAPGAADVGEMATPADRGEFVSGAHTFAGLTRTYKLYVPPAYLGRHLPLVVMLHGCTQDPDDFAAGTGMNERARAQGFFVLYPAQSREGNPSRCWNWFNRADQQRDAGEPGLIAGLTRAVIAQYGIDARRVYIAGMSAGGAMAAIVAEAYPEIYAAVGVHSGLPRGAASNMMGALSVMKSGMANPGLFGGAGRMGIHPAGRPEPRMTVPTIVFHGDADRTVHPRNGEQVIAAVLASAAAADTPGGVAAGGPRIEQGVSALGRRYTRSMHQNESGGALAEYWVVHGAGHAWSGGQVEGSYTDETGPDATGEMLRFFFAQPHGPAH